MGRREEKKRGKHFKERKSLAETIKIDTQESWGVVPGERKREVDQS